MVKEFNKILKINGNPPSQRLVFDKRLDRINEAISWSRGQWGNKDYHGIWTDGEYEIKLGKPGKETTHESGYKGQLNENDMRPDIFHFGKNLNLAATFGDVIYDLEEVAKKEKYCVELLAVLFFRSAFLLDHTPVTLEGGKIVYRYSPNKDVLDYISSRIGEIYNVPVEVFLHYLDAIALNEDVKYYTKGKDLSKVSTGGRNNYLTYVQIIAVITGDMPISTIARKLLRTNVAAISISDGLKVLPHVQDLTESI